MVLLVLFPETVSLDPLKAELNPIRHLLALTGAHHFVDVSRIRVKQLSGFCCSEIQDSTAGSSL
jgi:hypothetical protein